jgi:hypothetical protein
VAFEEARKTKRPVAVLVGDEYHGFNRWRSPIDLNGGWK